MEHTVSAEVAKILYQQQVIRSIADIVTILAPIATLSFFIFRQGQQNQEKWLTTEEKILAIMVELKMRPSRKKKTEVSES